MLHTPDHATKFKNTSAGIHTLAYDYSSTLFCKMVVEIWQLINLVRYGRHPPSWISWTPTGTTHQQYLLVFIDENNLDEIGRCCSRVGTILKLQG